MIEAHRQRLDAEGVVTLTIRARPNARATKLLDVLEDGSLKMDIHAAPEDGEANEEIVRHLARVFDVGVSQVELLSGHRGRQKIVRITRG